MDGKSVVLMGCLLLLCASATGTIQKLVKAAFLIRLQSVFRCSAVMVSDICIYWGLSLEH